MIAQGKAISHGARAIEYSMEKDKAQLVKVHDLPENIEPLAMWSRMMQHQHQCMKDRYNPHCALKYLQPKKNRQDGQ